MLDESIVIEYFFWGSYRVGQPWGELLLLLIVASGHQGKSKYDSLHIILQVHTYICIE